VVDKTKLANADLLAIFYEELKQLPDCPTGISLAIVPNRALGWTAIMSPAQRSKFPLFGKRFDELLTHLRKRYDLARD